MSEHDTRGKVAISPFLPEAADLPSEAVSSRSTRNRKLVARIAIYSESPPEKLLLQAGDTDGHQFDQQLHLILSLLLRSLILGQLIVDKRTSQADEARKHSHFH